MDVIKITQIVHGVEEEYESQSEYEQESRYIDRSNTELGRKSIRI
jgi:hypothetical protein